MVSSLRVFSRKLISRFSDCIITLTEQDKINYLNNLKIKGKIDFIYNPIENGDRISCDNKS